MAIREHWPSWVAFFMNLGNYRGFPKTSAFGKATLDFVEKAGV
jgi:hypothetical protein